MTEYIISGDELKEHTKLCVAYGATDNVRTVGDLSMKLDEMDKAIYSHPLASALEESYRNGFNDGQAEGMPTALKAEREKMLKELKDTCTQIDDNDQYYMWLEDVESVLLRGEP